MYDLNRALENWKSTFARNETCGRDELDELESHLRDQIEDLIRRGLFEQEAFSIACSRLGDPEQLGHQFAQANPSMLWKRRFFWMAAGAFCWLAIVLCQRILAAIAIMAVVHGGVHSGMGLGVANLAADLLFLLLALLGCRQLYRHGIPGNVQNRLTAFTSTRGRTSLCIIGVCVTGLLGKLLLAMPMVYASDTVPVQEMGRYVIYRTISGNLAMALLTITVIAFVFIQIARQRRAA